MRARTLFFQDLVVVAALLFGSICYPFNATNAATITSASGGTWSVGSTWVGGVVPQPGDDVVIQNFHFVTINSTETIASLTVNASSYNVLTIGAGSTLTVTGNVTLSSTAGATVSQLSCDGTLIVGGNINLNAVSIPAKSVIDMGANSNLYLDGNVVFGNAGRIYSSSDAFWTFHYTGSSAQTMTISGTSIVYNRLVIDNSAGVTVNGTVTASNVVGRIDIISGSLSNGGFAMTGNTDSTLTVNNGTSLILAGTTGLPAGFDMVVGAFSSISYTGSDQTVSMPNNSQNYGNLSIGVSGTATLGGNLTVDGNLTISSGTLDASSGNNYDITLAGSWLNSGGSFTCREGLVTFNGVAGQAITSNGSNFFDLTFNNVGAAGVSLNDDVTATNSITFTDGIITTAANILTISNTGAASISGFSGASFVNGNLRRYLTSNTSTYSFPVGDGLSASDYHRADVVNGNLDVSYITGSFGALSNHDNNDLTASDASLTYLSVAPDGVWFLTPNSQPGSGSYDVRLYITNFTSQFTDNEFGPLKRADNSTTAADWSATGTMNADNGLGRLVANGYGMRLGLTTFSQFGMGRASTNGNPLPVELVSFDAQPTDHETVHLAWVTALEIENDFFTVERSRDGLTFEAVGTLQGAGNSTIMQQYSLEDANPMKGTNYYRLKQVDYDGTTTYSSIVSVTFAQTEQAADITIYPNPVENGGTISIDAGNVSDWSASLTVVELGSGRVVLQQNLTALRNHINLTDALAAGVYALSINDGLQVINRKLLVQ